MTFLKNFRKQRRKSKKDALEKKDGQIFHFIDSASANLRSSFNEDRSGNELFRMKSNPIFLEGEAGTIELNDRPLSRGSLGSRKSEYSFGRTDHNKNEVTLLKSFSSNRVDLNGPISNENMHSSSKVNTDTIEDLKASLTVDDNLSAFSDESDGDTRSFASYEGRSSLSFWGAGADNFGSLSFRNAKVAEGLRSNIRSSIKLSRIKRNATSLHNDNTTKRLRVSTADPLFSLNNKGVEDIDDLLNSTWPTATFKLNRQWKSTPRIIARVQGPKTATDLENELNSSKNVTLKQTFRHSKSTPSLPMLECNDEFIQRIRSHTESEPGSAMIESVSRDSSEIGEDVELVLRHNETVLKQTEHLFNDIFPDDKADPGVKINIHKPSLLFSRAAKNSITDDLNENSRGEFQKGLSLDGVPTHRAQKTDSHLELPKFTPAPRRRHSQSSIVVRKDGQFTLKNSAHPSPLRFQPELRSNQFFRRYSNSSMGSSWGKPPLDIRALIEAYENRDRNSVDAYLMGNDADTFNVTKEEHVMIVQYILSNEEDREFNVFPDRACKRTILAFQVNCYNYGSDCDWTGELGNLQDHLEQCQLIEVACVNACGRTDIPRNQMNQHTDADGDCPLAVVACRYSDVGCKSKARRVDMEVHYGESTEDHLKLAHTRIRELEIRQETICMNGKFLWKISNYDMLMKQSATKKDKEKLCSPPFYTGQYGYKLRAEAFLNGLGQGKGSHLSLYVVIMKGEYDAILPWSFKQNVDFVLIDQDDEVNNRVNKIWKLSCERNSDYFKRPNKSKSLGFGCPKFVSLETLKTRNYIKDQTLFIKIEVEPTDCLIFSPQSSSH